MSAVGEVARIARRTPAAVLGWEEQLFALAIIAVSVMESPLMQVQILPVPGFKAPNLIFGAAFLAFVLSPGKLVPSDRLGRIAFFAFLAYATFFLIDFARSLPDLAIFHARFPKIFPVSVLGYIDSDFVVGLLFACTFLYVLLRMCNSEGFTLVLRTISLASFVVSCTVIIAVFLNLDALFDTSPTRAAILKVIDGSLGLHYNTVSNMLATTAPILLYMSLKRGSIWTANYALALVAVLFLKSRTGLLTFGGISVVTMIVLGRVKELVAATPVIVIAVFVALGPMLIQLLSIGFTQKSGISSYALLSGREQSIWLPLLFEWFNDSHRLFFGEGLGGIMTSDILYSGLFFAAGEAHNLYLEFFLDNGIVLFVIFILGLVAWIVWAARLARRFNNSLFWVLFLCVIAFLLTGFTGRHYLPHSDNGLMFPIVAALINVARMKLQVATKPRGA